MRRLAYLRQHRSPIYSGMLMTGTLNAHLEEIDRAELIYANDGC